MDSIDRRTLLRLCSASRPHCRRQRAASSNCERKLRDNRRLARLSFLAGVMVVLPGFFLLLALQQPEPPRSNFWQLVFVVLAALMGMGVVKLIGYIRKHDAEKEARQILKNAEVQAAARHKEAGQQHPADQEKRRKTPIGDEHRGHGRDQQQRDDPGFCQGNEIACE